MLSIRNTLSITLAVALAMLSGCRTPCASIKSAGWQECRLDVTRAVEPGQVLLVHDGMVQQIGSWDLGGIRSEPVEVANYDRKSNWAFDLSAGLGSVPGLPTTAEARLKAKGAKKVRVTFEESAEHYLAEFINRSSNLRDLQAGVDELLGTLRRDQPAAIAGAARSAAQGAEVWLVLGTLTSKVEYSFHRADDVSFSAPIPLEGITVTGAVAAKSETNREVRYRSPMPIAYNAIQISFRQADGLQGADPSSIRAGRRLGGPDQDLTWRLDGE